MDLQSHEHMFRTTSVFLPIRSLHTTERHGNAQYQRVCPVVLARSADLASQCFAGLQDETHCSPTLGAHAKHDIRRDRVMRRGQSHWKRLRPTLDGGPESEAAIARLQLGVRVNLPWMPPVKTWTLNAQVRTQRALSVARVITCVLARACVLSSGVFMCICVCCGWLG